MGSKILARVLLALGFLAAWVGYTTWYGFRLAFDPSATRNAAHAILAAPSVQRSLSDTISEQVDRELTSKGASPKVAAAVDAALRDPRVTTAFADAIAQIHQAMLLDSSGKVTLDARALTTAVHDALAEHDPQLAAQLDQHAPIKVELGGKDLPHLGSAHDTMHQASAIAILCALVFLGLSLLLCHERKAFARVGRRVAYLAIGPLLWFEVLPVVLGHVDGDAPQVAGAVLRTYRARVVPSAIALVVLGVGIVVASMVGPRLLHTVVTAAEPTGEPAAGDAVAPRALGPTPLRPAPPSEPVITEKMYL